MRIADSDGVDVQVEQAPYRFLEAEEAVEFLSQGYARLRLQVQQRPRSVAHAGSIYTAGALSIDRISHGLTASGMMDPFPDLTVGYLRGGRMDLDSGRFGRDQVELGQSWAYVQEAPSAVSWGPTEAEMVRLPWNVFTSRAADLTGLGAEAVRLESISPISPAAARTWQAVSALVLAELSAPDAAVSALVHDALVGLVVSTVLHVFPNTTIGRDDLPGPGEVHSAAIRRAIAFIDENAHRPIGAGEIAAAARLSVRGLQAGFRRSVGATPKEYLTRVRLEGARRDLLAADPTTGAIVAAIARTWGFAHLGRFSARYREEFDELPSRTLHR